jgi:hypothetical protein
MTESEWLAATNLRRMLDYAVDHFSQRKHRLFACGCCRLAWDRLISPVSRAAVETAERFAEGFESAETLEFACTDGFARYSSSCSWFDSAARSTAIVGAFHASLLAMERMALARELDHSLLVRVIRGKHIRSQIARAHTTLLRCIFGNPFSPVAFAESWRSETAVALAAGIYAERAFDRLPILADALEEAGCDHPDVLTHCRGPGPHARGCWVVDGVLGKA